MKTIAIIPAGGEGKRFNKSLPKQFHQIHGKEILIHSLEVFQKCSLIDEIVVSTRKNFIKFVDDLAGKYCINKLKKTVEGGKERQDSVYNAVKSIKAQDEDLVVIHDAVRPLLTEKLLIKTIKTAEKFDNVTVCLKARDTLVKGKEFVNSYIERDNIFYVQTPQVFRYKILKEAMEQARKENFYGTDESMLVVRAGHKVKLLDGSSLNIKITLSEDINLLNRMLK
jgi:2-C-methyl-D-erythritol 4-phosphate cytidylyltransferase